MGKVLRLPSVERRRQVEELRRYLAPRIRDVVTLAMDLRPAPTLGVLAEALEQEIATYRALAEGRHE